MPKRNRAESPASTITVDGARKRLSLSALAAKASSGSLRHEPDASFLGLFHTAHGRLKRSSSSSVSLRSSSTPLLKPSPLKPGLRLSAQPLQTHPEHDVASIRELLLFPTSLAIIRHNWIFRFSIDCTPQLGPALPAHIEDQLYTKYVASRPLPRPEKLPYFHIGSTALGFRLNFYLVLPYASTASGPSGAGNLCFNELQQTYDRCIRPALEIAYPRRQRWNSWIEGKNESRLKSSRRTSTRCEAREETIQCEGLATFWTAIEARSKLPDIAPLMRGRALVAYGDVQVHDWHNEWRPSWAQFTQLWNDGVDPDFVGTDAKFTMEMTLGFDIDSITDKATATKLPTAPPHRVLSPLHTMYSPPPSAPPRTALPPVPQMPVIPKRTRRRVSSRHSIKLVDPGLEDLLE